MHLVLIVRVRARPESRLDFPPLLAGLSPSIPRSSRGSPGATASASALAGSFVTLETTVNAALGGLGADIRAINLQNEFLGQVRDATEEGLGNIIDADMARESAKLSSLQIRQELGMQVTGIANTAPQSLLGLFK